MTLLTRESTKCPREGLKTTGWEPESCRKEEISQLAGTIHMRSPEYQKFVRHCAMLSWSHVAKEILGFALEKFTWQSRWTSWHLGSITPSLAHERAGMLSVDIACQGLLTTQVVVEVVHSPQDHSSKCACTLSSSIGQRTSELRQQLLLWPVSCTAFVYAILSPFSSFANKR